eukprot:4041741-Amphidinium_carterae.1
MGVPSGKLGIPPLSASGIRGDLPTPLDYSVCRPVARPAASSGHLQVAAAGLMQLAPMSSELPPAL